MAILERIIGDLLRPVGRPLMLPPFTPEYLFSDGEQGVFYDPSDLTTLYQDAAGTTPVTSAGDPVGLMLDKSGNGNHAVQSTSAARPTYQTDGTYHWLEFDGVDDALQTAVITAGASRMSFFAPITRGADDSLRMLVEYGNTSGDAGSFYFASPVGAGNVIEVRPNIGGVGNRYRYTDTSIPSKGIYTMQVDSTLSGGNEVSLRKDGVSVGAPVDTSDTSGTFANHKFNLGSRNNSSLYFKGDIYGTILVFGDVADNDRNNTEQYLASKSGVVIA